MGRRVRRRIYRTQRRSELGGEQYSFFSEVLEHTHSVGSVLELGANIGLNLRAIRQLLPGAKLGAVEINAAAAMQLEAMGGIEVRQQSILDYDPPAGAYDFVLIKGVLIHINPDFLGQVYDVMHRASARYVCIAEYYNPTPVAIPYRGHADRLFKRDFAGDFMERFDDVSLRHYGFRYRRDPNFPQDDVTWFLLEKKG